MVYLKEARARECFLSRFFKSTSSGVSRRMSCAISILCRSPHVLPSCHSKLEAFLPLPSILKQVSKKGNVVDGQSSRLPVLLQGSLLAWAKRLQNESASCLAWNPVTQVAAGNDLSPQSQHYAAEHWGRNSPNQQYRTPCLGALEWGWLAD
jgi:hypothetical protein